MKKSPWRRLIFCSCISLLVAAHAAGAQSAPPWPPPPASPPVSSALRQRLRASLLQVDATAGPDRQMVRGIIALPLAQIGDFEEALRLARWGKKLPADAEAAGEQAELQLELWQWRVGQLAHDGKWREVPAAAGHLRAPSERAFALLRAAHGAVERGVRVDGTAPAVGDLKTILAAASALIEKNRVLKLQPYNAYLWARAGDPAMADRLYRNAFDAAMNKAVAQPKGQPQDELFFMQEQAFADIKDVLTMQARSGLLHSALQQARERQLEIRRLPLEGWLALSLSEADRLELEPLIRALPAGPRTHYLFQLAAAAGRGGDTARARAWFNEARLLAAGLGLSDVPEAQVRAYNELAAGFQRGKATAKTGQTQEPGPLWAYKFRASQLAVAAAYFLHDAGARDSIKQELHTAMAKAPAGISPPDLDEYLMYPYIRELTVNRWADGPASRISPARLDEISRDLLAATPLVLQFEAFKLLARELQHQPAKLLPLARGMLKTAQALQDSPLDLAAGPRRSVLTTKTAGPKWPVSPEALESARWLARAGDRKAAYAALGIGEKISRTSRPGAALALHYVGFHAEADGLYDLKKELPRLNALERIAQGEGPAADKASDEMVIYGAWPEFAAIEARYRAPEAPFRWFGGVTGAEARALTLREWIFALYPEANETPSPLPPDEPGIPRRYLAGSTE